MGRVLTVAVLLSLCACVPAKGETYWSTNILNDTTWTLSGSPYILMRDISVRFGKTLTIEPGVTVAFNGNYLLGVESNVPYGSIVALGTADSNIVFTSNLPVPAVGSWKNVTVVSSTSSSAFSYCVFLYGTQGLYLSRASIPVDHCTFQTCQTGVSVYESSPTLTTCAFMDCTFAGVFCQKNVTDEHVCSPVIYDCTFSNPAVDAMNVRLSGYSDPPLETIVASQNWWGTTVESEIQAKIYDRNDNTGIWGQVDYTDFYSAPAVEQSSWGAIKALFRW